MSGLISKSDFIGLEQVAHLAAGGEAPVLGSHIGVTGRFLLDKGVGMPGRERMFAVVERVRARLGELLDVSSSAISFLLNATAGLRVAAEGIDWRAGDNLVVARAEFPSHLTVWQGRGRESVEVRRIGRTETPTLDEFSAATDSRTRVISVSHVSYLTGARQDLAALREIADRVGARLVVDASHSLGVIPVPAKLCDIVVSCAYKFLLATHGIGVLFVNPDRWPELSPSEIGWHSVEPQEDWRLRDSFRVRKGAERFEPGNVSFLSAYLLDNSLSVLVPIGARCIESHVLDLSGELRRGLAQLGVTLLTPDDHSARAGNVCFRTNRSEQLEVALRQMGILTWAGDGRLRLSVHVYNDNADVRRALDGLADLVRGET